MPRKEARYVKHDFKVGDSVDVLLPDGKTWKFGQEITHIIEKYPEAKGELMWGIPWGNPFPLIGISIDGRGLHADGTDIEKGNIKHSEKKIEKPRSLEEELSSIIVDKSEAYTDLDEEDSSGAKGSLWSHMPELLQELIKPLLKMNVFPCDIRTASLGEFDNASFTLTSTKIGRAVRNSGQPGFVLTITVDGYAPTTMDLQINEAFYWGEETK
jgi:hypothetical protein